MRITVGILIAVMLMVVLAGCGGRNHALPVGSGPPDVPIALPSPPVDPQAESPATTTDAMGLVSPADALAAIADRTSSELLLWREGHDYVAGLAQRVVDREVGARYYPGQLAEMSVFEKLAFAIYNFNLEGYNGISELTYEWGDEPEDYSNLWIGLSNWDKNSWEWQLGPADGTLELGPGGITSLVNPTTSDVFVAVVLLDSEPATLDWLKVGESPPDPIVITGVTPNPVLGYAGQLLVFDVQFLGADDETVTYSWDFGGGATPNNSTQRNPDVTLGDVGDYDGLVIVDNAYGPPDSFSFAMSIAEPNPSEWPMFGMNAQHTRQSPYVGAQTNNVKWKFWSSGTGFGFSDSIIGPDGTIYVGSGQEVRALNPDGSVKWYSEPISFFTRPALATDGTVYIGGYHGDVYAINPGGSIKWTYPTGGAITSSPAIGADGTVYIGSSDDNLYAINPDGSLKWSFTTGSSVWSSPAIGADGTIYVGSWDDNLYAVNPDGSLKWLYTTGDPVFSSPTIGADGTIYVGSNDRKLYAINPDGSLKWSYTTEGSVESSPAIGADGTVYVGSMWPDNSLHAINPDGSLKWSYTTDDEVKSSPAVGADGTVYVGSRDGFFYAINPDGSLKWSYLMGGAVFESPAIAADGTIYVSGNRAYFTAFDPDGGVKWLFGAGNAVTSSPAIGADGTVYVGC